MKGAVPHNLFLDTPEAGSKGYRLLVAEPSGLDETEVRRLTSEARQSFERQSRYQGNQIWIAPDQSSIAIGKWVEQEDTGRDGVEILLTIGQCEHDREQLVDRLKEILDDFPEKERNSADKRRGLVLPSPYLLGALQNLRSEDSKLIKLSKSPSHSLNSNMQPKKRDPVGGGKQRESVYRGPFSKPLFGLIIRSVVLALLLFFSIRYFVEESADPVVQTEEENSIKSEVTMTSNEFSELDLSGQEQLIRNLKNEDQRILNWWKIRNSSNDESIHDTMRFLDNFRGEFSGLAKTISDHEELTHFATFPDYKKDLKSCFLNLSDWDDYFLKVENSVPLPLDKNLKNILWNLTTFTLYKRFDECSVDDLENYNQPQDFGDLRRDIESRLDRAKSPVGHHLELQTSKVFDAYRKVADLVMKRLVQKSE